MLMFRFFAAFMLGCMLNVSCRNNEEACVKHFEQANNYLTEFYIDGNTSKLDASLLIINNEIYKCPTFALDYTNLKLSVLLNKGDYVNAITLIYNSSDSLFGLLYKKEMTLSVLKAMYCEKLGNLQLSKKYYLLSENIVEQFLVFNPNNEEAIIDYFTIKTNHRKPQEVMSEFTEYGRKYELDSNFMNALGETLGFYY